MATWGVEARIKYRAWNTSTDAGVAGDSANHTLTLRRAGTDSAFVGTVNDLGNGVYEAVVSGTLTETYELAMRGTSSTADVVLFFEAPVRTVKAGALTPEQAALLEAIGEKTALIGTDGALAEIVSPIGSGGEITLYSGVDYVDTAAGPLVIPVPAAVQSRAPAVDQPVYFQGRRRRTGTDYFDVAGVVIDNPDSPGSKAVSVPIPRGSIDSEFPFDDNWFYFVGDRPGSLQDAFIAGALKLCPGPIVPA